MTGRALELLVFGLVGASATAVYFGVAIMVYAIPPFNAHPASAAFVASVASVLWSYAGHHRFTFRRSGSHHFYLPRFVGISVMLSAMAVCGTYIATQSFGVGYQLATLCVTISYPIASFALNRSWVFVERNSKAIDPFGNCSARQESDNASTDAAWRQSDTQTTKWEQGAGR